MPSKIGNGIVAVGCLMAAVGLCFLLAAFGDQSESALRGTGTMAFSVGMLLAAAGFYVKARSLVDVEGAQPKAPRRGKRKICDACGTEESAVQCLVHQVNLCPECLGTHYEFKACAYAPSTRAPSPKAKARSAGA